MRANMTEKLYRLTLKFCDEFENGHSSVPASSTVHCWKNFFTMDLYICWSYCEHKVSRFCSIIYANIQSPLFITCSPLADIPAKFYQNQA